MDNDNKEALFRLLRFNTVENGSDALISIDEYVEKMPESQEKIYFVVHQSFDQAAKSPFMEPFKGTDIDVLILTNNIDEILFQQNENYKGKKFVNIESSYEQIYKDLGKK